MMNETEACVALWQTCFGEEAEAARACLCIPDVTLITLREENTVVAMAVSVPVYTANEQGSYLYAVCVDPAWRGRGYFRRLMQKCEADAQQKQSAFVCLIPANEILGETYRRMGYGKTVALWDAMPASAEQIRCASEGFALLAKEWYENEHCTRYGLLKRLVPMQKNNERELAFSCPMGEV